MYSAYKLNKQCDNITVLMSFFPSFEPGSCSMTGSKGCFLTCKVSQEASKVVWYSCVFRHFPQFVWSTQRLPPSQWSRSRWFFLEFPCFFYDPADVGNLISGSYAFSKSSLYIWKFLVHVLLKPSLENFEHYLASEWDECNWVVVWIFFGIDLFGIGMKTDLFQSCGHCWLFQMCWHIECSTFTASSFRIFHHLH